MMPDETSPLRRELLRDTVDLAAVLRLLDSGEDVNERDELGMSLLDLTILGLASHPQRVEIVRSLLERGADPKIRAYEGAGPLYSASLIRDATIMEMLLRAGADPNAEADRVETVYDWAEFDYRFDEYDLHLPENPEPKDKASEEAWLDFLDRLAVKYGKQRPDYVRVLRQYGAKRYSEIRAAAGSQTPVR